MNEPSPELLSIERYLDLTPRTGATAAEVGPFTLFISNGPWPYYARPRSGPRPPITASDIDDLRRACEARDVPVGIEWIHDLDPSLATVAADAGLTVLSRPLLALAPADFVRSRTTHTARTRILTADDDLATARAVADLGFDSPGTGVGQVGPPERDRLAATFSADLLRHMHDRCAAGVTVIAAGFDRDDIGDGIGIGIGIGIGEGIGDDGMVAVGMHQPLGRTTEIVGVATLPVTRRRGWATAVTSALVEHALSTGVTCVLLSADSQEVAGIYRRLGFRVVGVFCEAAPPG